MFCSHTLCVRVVQARIGSIDQSVWKLIRCSKIWSEKLSTALLSFRHVHPNIQQVFGDHSSMDDIMAAVDSVSAVSNGSG